MTDGGTFAASPADAAPDAIADAAIPAPVTPPTFAAKTAPRACPDLPESTEFWREEVAPGCAAYPIGEVLALYNAPNICDGPCPKPCQIIREGTVSTVSYDASGRWIAIAPLINGYAGSSESCSYDTDHARWPTRCTRVYSESTSATTTVKRDEKGRVVEVSGDDVSSFTYDHAGHVALTSGPDQRVIHSYDRRGRLVGELDRTPGSTAYGQRTTYGYDAAGRLVTRTSPGVRRSFRYIDNRLVEQTTAVTRMNGTQTHTVTFSYDASGRPATIDDFTLVYACPSPTAQPTPGH